MTLTHASGLHKVFFFLSASETYFSVAQNTIFSPLILSQAVKNNGKKPPKKQNSFSTNLKLNYECSKQGNKINLSQSQSFP